MNEESDNRQDKLEEMKAKISEFKNDNISAKEKTIDDIKKAKKMAKNFEKIETQFDIINQIISAVEPHIHNITEENWMDIKNWWGYNYPYLEKQDAIAKQYVADQLPISNETVTTTNVTTSVSGNIVMNFYDVLSNSQYDFGPQFQEIKVIETIPENEKIIKEFLEKIDKDYAEKFEGITTDWASTPPSEKYKVLGNVRNLIFSVVFPKLANRSEAVKLPWETKLEGKPYRKEIGPAKHFILGHRDESTLSPTTVDIIDKIAESLGYDFGKLSHYSKQGGKAHEFRITYRDTLSHFAEAIKLRQRYWKPPEGK